MNSDKLLELVTSDESRLNVQLKDAQVTRAGRDVSNTVNNYYNYPSFNGSTLELFEVLRGIPDPKDCFWDRSQACLAETRANHIEELVSWVNHCPEGSHNTYLLADAAGSGKTSLAHSVCQLLHSKGHLVASYFCRPKQGGSIASQVLGAVIRGLLSINDQTRRCIGGMLLEDLTLATASPARQFDEIIIPVARGLPSKWPLVVVIDGLDGALDIKLLTLLRDSLPSLPSSFKFILMTRPEPQVMSFLDKSAHIRRASYSLAGVHNHRDLDRYIRHRVSRTTYGTSISEELLQAFVERTEGVFLWAATVINYLEIAFNPILQLEALVKPKASLTTNTTGPTERLDEIYSVILSKLPWSDAHFREMYEKVMGAMVILQEPLSLAGFSSLYAHDGVTIDDMKNICKHLQPLFQTYNPDDHHQPLRLLHVSVKEYLTTRAPEPHRLDPILHHRKLSSLALLVIQKDLNQGNVPSLGFTSGEWDESKAIPLLEREPMLPAHEHIWYSCRHVAEHILAASIEDVEPSLVQLVREVLLSDPRPMLEATASLGSLIDLGTLRKLAARHSSGVMDEMSLLAAARSLCSVAACLKGSRITEALLAAQEAASLYRLVLASNLDPAVELDCARSFRLLSSILATLRQYDESLTTIDEGLVIARKSAEGSTESQRVLAQLLYHRAISLTKLDRHDAALEAGSESIQIYRLLVTANPDLELPFALALHSQAWTLAAHKRHKDAIPFVDECIAYMRRLGQDPAVLVGSVRLYASCLWYTGQTDSALKHKQEVVDILRQLSSTNASYFQPRLAYLLHKLASDLRKCGLLADAIVAAEEAISVRRELAILDPSTYDSILQESVALHSKFRFELDQLGHKDAVKVFLQLKDHNGQTYDPLLAHSLQQLVDELESNQPYPECVAATRELVEVKRRLLDREGGASRMLLRDLAGSLDRHAWSLTLVKRHSDAIKCAEEAVTIYRRLLEEDGATVEPALAPALHRLARAYGECKRYEEAIPVLQEAVDVRKRLVGDALQMRERSASVLGSSPQEETVASSTPLDQTTPKPKSDDIESQLEAPTVPIRDIDQATTTVLASSAIDTPHIDPSSDPVPQDESSDAQSQDLDQHLPTNIGVPPAIPQESAAEGGTTSLATPPSTPDQAQDSDAAPTDIVQGTESSAPPQLPDSGDVPVITAQVIPPIPDQPFQDNGAEPGPEQAVPPAVVDVPLQEEARQVVPTEVSDITVQLPEGNGAGEPLPNHAPPCFEFDPSKHEAYVGLGTSLHFLGRYLVTSKRHSEALPLLEEAITIRRWLVDQTSEISTSLKDLADTLDHCLLCLRGLKMWKIALDSAQEWTGVYRRLVEVCPGTKYEGRLAKAERFVENIRTQALAL
ncbi:hypothetical protein FA15DRAFT_676320 [Coprinopsis marcescibilis]|uniref:Nephrocystin 3-like N-terminal domain-containing protein n=1 Tax=Coprinopsis marcescibilis TaxID=230819 RepID=A0A5C3KAV3_COPMA|nr:hypothetical protein FA15DRAFT_676320 [Coprinopsis marcescibilis]